MHILFYAVKNNVSAIGMVATKVNSVFFTQLVKTVGADITQIACENKVVIFGSGVGIL